jgi:translation initiation factor 2B subunit (eIF-2B alpha/beta/delta family)
MTVLTHSRSSQVMALFEQALEQHQDFKVIITISAPGNEGLLVASQLNRLGIPVTLITDAEMGLVMPEVDINLSGCDSWLTDHHFVNKTGTLLQALAAQHFGKPFWVLADSFKNSHQISDEVTLEAMPTDELPLPEGDRIAAKNVYFETISTRLVTGRVDEHGLQVLQP